MNATPELINFLITDSGALKKRPGLVTVNKYVGEARINALWNGDIEGVETTLIAYGRTVYRYIDGVQTNLGSTIGETSQFIKFGTKVYCIGCYNLYVIDSNGLRVAEAYIPIVATALSPDGAGTVFEQPNRLSMQRRAQYCADGESLVYHLPEPSVFTIDKVVLNGAEVSRSLYTTSNIDKTVTFNAPPAAGLNNVEITYSVSPPAGWSGLTRCRHGIVFEDRLFIYGEDEKENYLYHSSLANGMPDCTYFAEGDYHVFDEAIMGLTPCFSRLIIFFEHSAKFTYANLITDSLGNSRTAFPVFELNGSKGTLRRGMCELVQNTPITLCDDGLNRWVSTYISDERSAQPFSQRMFKLFQGILAIHYNSVLLNRKNKSELWMTSPRGILIYNYKLDCFYIYAIYSVAALCEEGENVLIASNDGTLSRLTEGTSHDNGQDILAIAQFPFCTFGTPFLLKSLSEVVLEVEGEKAFSANIMLDRGNRTQTESLYPSIDVAVGAALRRIKIRCPLKRFYSCHAVIETYAEDACIRSIGFAGSYIGGGQKVN